MAPVQTGVSEPTTSAVPTGVPSSTTGVGAQPETTVTRLPGEIFTVDGGPGPTVLLIGDSSMAGIRWYDGVAEHLTGGTYLVDVESCRRIADESCVGREGVAPTTVMEALRSAAQTPVDILIVMAGYNEGGADFDRRVQLVGDAASSLGVGRPVWMRFSQPDPAHSAVDTRGHNEGLDVATRDASTWAIADWPGFAAGLDGVFEQDRIHLTRTGAVELAEFVSSVVMALDDPDCTVDRSGPTCAAMPYLRVTSADPE